MDAVSQTLSPWCGTAQAAHATVGQITLSTLTLAVSAGYRSNEYEAAVVEHHECQSQRMVLLAKFVQELHPSREAMKKLQTILWMMILAICSDLTRSVQRAPRQGLQVPG